MFSREYVIDKVAESFFKWTHTVSYLNFTMGSALYMILPTYNDCTIRCTQLNHSVADHNSCNNAQDFELNVSEKFSKVSHFSLF